MNGKLKSQKGLVIEVFSWLISVDIKVQMKDPGKANRHLIETHLS